MELITIKHNSFTSITTIYTRKELQQAWHTDGQGHKEAVERGYYCIVARCNKNQALKLHALALRRFNIPTCGHYNGKTFSFFCGHAGHTDIHRLMFNLFSIFETELRWPNKHRKLRLFAKQ